MEDKKKMVGWAWVAEGLRPIYDKREIKKGHNKGKFMVEYLAGWSADNQCLRYKKLIVLASDLQAVLHRSPEEWKLVEHDRRNVVNKEVQ